jgi:hypothetical protein
LSGASSKCRGVVVKCNNSAVVFKCNNSAVVFKYNNSAVAVAVARIFDTRSGTPVAKADQMVRQKL